MVTRAEAAAAPTRARGQQGGSGHGRAPRRVGPRVARERLNPRGAAGGPMRRGTMPQPGAWPGASCAEKPAWEAGAAAPEGGKAAAGGPPRAAMRCAAEQ